MNVKEIAESISSEDRNAILNSGKQIRRSRIEVINDEDDSVKASTDDKIPETEEPTSKRKSVDREWPTVGTEVTATNPWSGIQYPVEVVVNKKRKHGVEFRIETGQQFHSPSPMCQFLFGKRVSNGWDCLSWEIGDGDND